MSSLGDVVLLAIIGKIFTFLWMSFPIPNWMMGGKIEKLWKCELCSGTWVYSFVYLLLGVDVLPLLGLPHINYMGEILTGGAISFIVFLMSVGFKEQYMSFYIE